MAGPDVCTGSPWKAPLEIVSAALDLHRHGISVVRLTDDELLTQWHNLYRITNDEPKATEVVTQTTV